MSKIILFLVLVLTSTMFIHAQSNNEQNSADIGEIDRLNREVKRLYGNGEYSEAIKISKEELILREKVYGGLSEDVLVAHINLGYLYRLKRDYKSSVFSFQNALRIQQANKNSQIVDVLKEIGFTYLYDGKKTEAENAFQDGLAVVEKMFGKFSKETLNLLMHFAAYYDMVGKKENADAMFLRGIEIAKNSFEERSEEDVLAFESYRCFLKNTEGEKKADEVIKKLLRPKAKSEDDSAPVKGGVINGKAVSLPRPFYPYEARQSGTHGTVVILVTIDETGKVYKALAICGHPLLRSAALSAAKIARFSPTLLNGTPVKVTGTINYNFMR